MNEKNIKITIATVCYNAESQIQRTLDSVAEQDDRFIEHLIIDGQSGDSTLKKIQAYALANSKKTFPHEIKWLSEPDKGIYDAMNKALWLASGDYIVFLNAGDSLHEKDTIAQVKKVIAASGKKPGLVYGDTVLVDETGRFLRPRRLYPPKNLQVKDFKNGMLGCHQSFYANMEVASHIFYNLKYKYSADYDWTIRVMKKAEEEQMPLVFADAITADYLSEGMTTRHHRESLLERFHVMAQHYGKWTAVWRHVWFALRVFIKR